MVLSSCRTQSQTLLSVCQSKTRTDVISATQQVPVRVRTALQFRIPIIEICVLQLLPAKIAIVWPLKIQIVVMCVFPESARQGLTKCRTARVQLLRGSGEHNSDHFQGYKGRRDSQEPQLRSFQVVNGFSERTFPSSTRGFSRTIQRFGKENSVITCAVFLAYPR